MTQVQLQVTEDQQRNLLVGAIEGGSNYWYMIDSQQFPEGIVYEDFREGGKFALDEYWHPFYLIPFHPGCALVFEAEDHPGQFLLDKAALDRGTQIMAEKFAEHFGDWMEENDDATTADVFLQCCLFGELIFG